MNVKSILLVIAMQGEAQPILEALGIGKESGTILEPPLPAVFYSIDRRF